MLTYDKGKLLKSLFAFAMMFLIWNLPAVAPITEVGMRVLGVFVGTILLISLVDATWPSILVMALFAITGIMSVNQAIMRSIGAWVTIYILFSFVLTYALNEVGFTSRLVRWFMSKKFVNKSPWIFTFSVMGLGMMVTWFLEPVPVTAFFLMFSARIYEELGYEKGDFYPALLTMGLVFSINISGAMTPISHPLCMMGMEIYNMTAQNPITLVQYLVFGFPIGLILFVILCGIMYYFTKPNFDKFENFDVNNILDKHKPMDLREKLTVGIFFGTVFLWLLPGVLAILHPGTAVEVYLNRMGLTFISIISVVLLAVINVDGEPLLDLKDTLKNGISWPVIFLVGAAILLGAGVSNPDTGITKFISVTLVPLVSGLNPLMIVLILVFTTCMMTNFSSNATTVIVMTTVAVSTASTIQGLNPRAMAVVIPFVSALAFCIPASFATVAMAYGDEYTKGGLIFRNGVMMVVATTIISTLGYYLAILVV